MRSQCSLLAGQRPTVAKPVAAVATTKQLILYPAAHASAVADGSVTDGPNDGSVAMRTKHMVGTGPKGHRVKLELNGLVNRAIRARQHSREHEQRYRRSRT